MTNNPLSELRIIDGKPVEVIENDQFGYTVYRLDMWDKRIVVIYNHEENSITIKGDTNCPRCGTPFLPKPEHGQTLCCKGCDADFEFFGVGHPMLKGPIKWEVEKALGINI